MATPILDNIQVKINTIKDERASSPDGKTSATGNDVQQKAIAAIHGGAAEWAQYMKLFAGQEGSANFPRLLARLIPTDGTHANDAMRTARAYLVGNGVCGAITGDGLDREVTIILDQGF